MSDQATETGPLSVDAAIQSLLTAEPAAAEQDDKNTWGEGLADAVEKVDATVSGEEPKGDDQTPEEADAEPVEQADAEDTEAEPEPVAAHDPPKYWSQDAKARFAELSPELQAVVLSQEGPREEAAAKAKAEAAQVRQAADKELQGVQKLAEALSERLPQWITAFENRWGTTNPDWVSYAQEHGAEAMTLAKAQFDQERQQLVEADQARTLAEQQAHEAFLKAESARLVEIAPDLADPEKGGAKRQEVASYLLQSGIPQEALRQISAVELSIAQKAMLWDRTQAALKAAPKPKPAAPPPKTPVRPASAATAPNPIKQARGRFDQAPTMENAIALLLAPKR